MFLYPTRVGIFIHGSTLAKIQMMQLVVFGGCHGLKWVWFIFWLIFRFFHSHFWNHVWFLGVYDHPAVIDYVLSLTNDTKVYYAGHSQGTTSLLVLLSKRPEYNQKIRVSSLMAPIAFETHIESKPKQFFESFLKFLVR